MLPATAPLCGSAVRSASDSAAAAASTRYRFKFWGKATVVDSNTIQLNDGSMGAIKVIAQGYSGIGSGDFVCATGTLDTTAGEPVLLSSSDQVRMLD